MSAIDAGRLARAIWLDVKPVAPGTYLVSGGIDSHSQRVGDQCKHALIVRLHCGDPDVVKALRQLVGEPAQRRKVGAA